jgi:hypothetical protein
VRIFLLCGENCFGCPGCEAGEFPDSLGPDEPGALKQSTIEWVASTGKPYLSNDPYRLEIGSATSIPYSRMTVPIKMDRDILGVLDIIDDDRKVCRCGPVTIWPLADQVATAMENAVFITIAGNGGN